MRARSRRTLSAAPGAMPPGWILQAAFFALSAALTGAGILADGVPFAVAYIPLGLALLAPSLPQLRTGSHTAPLPLTVPLVTGHFLWPMLISGWGLVQLGYAPGLVVIIGLAATLAVGGLARLCGLALTTALLLALPFFPANPLLVTGSLLPGSGLAGLAILWLWAALIEWCPHLMLRAALLAGLVSALLGLAPHPEQSAHWAAESARAFEEIGIASASGAALTERGRWQQIVTRAGLRIRAGDTLILGENIFDHEDHAAVHWWCRIVRAHNLTALIGVRAEDGLGEVWQFDRHTCPTPARLYRAEIGIPIVNAGWWPSRSAMPRDEAAGGISSADAQSPNTHLPNTEWLICFEAFSIWRWIDVGWSGAAHAVILAHDRWTAPIPTARLRRKVARQFAALYGIRVHHADTGATVLRSTVR